MLLANIHIVLARPSHPGNIGATARAMKNMGLSGLRLVSPDQFPHVDAKARASGADDILESAQIHDGLDSAIADCVYVVGTTARERSIEWPLLTPRQCAQDLLMRAQDGPVALVFGRERTGLMNEEVDRCQALVRIPTSRDYASLNLASAVLVLAYELHLAAQEHASGSDEKTGLANALAPNKDLEQFYEHMERVLVEIGFLDPDNPRLLMRRLRRLYNRAGLINNELNILRGILTAIQQTEYWRAKR